MRIKKRQIARQQIKSSEGEFLYELQHLYELAPKLSSLILMSAKECLLRDYHDNKLVWYAVLEKYGSNNTIFLKDVETIDNTLNNAKDKIDSLKK